MGLLWWQAELAGYQVIAFGLQVLVEDDFIHRLAKVLVYLVQILYGFIGALAAQVLGGLGQLKDAVGLVGVDVWDLVLRHVLNVVGVLDQRVRVDSVLNRLFKPTGENSRVLVIKHYIDAVESATFLGVFPVGLIALRLGQVLKDTELAPVLHLVGVLPEALSANTLLGNAAFPLEPVNRHSCIEL